MNSFLERKRPVFFWCYKMPPREMLVKVRWPHWELLCLRRMELSEGGCLWEAGQANHHTLSFGRAIFGSDSIPGVTEISNLLVSARESFPFTLTSPILTRSLHPVFMASQSPAFILVGGWSLFRISVVDDHWIKGKGSDAGWARMGRPGKWKPLSLKMGHSPGPHIAPRFCSSHFQFPKKC